VQFGGSGSSQAYSGRVNGVLGRNSARSARESGLQVVDAVQLEEVVAG
jgi:hypothetical protein